MKQLSTRIKDAGIAIRHSRGGILFYTAGSRNGLEVVDIRGTDTQKEVDPNKSTFFVIEKCVEDVKQDEKHVPDLLEPIMRPTCLVKEELRQSLLKMTQVRPETTKMRVCTFQMSGKNHRFGQRSIGGSNFSNPHPLFAIFGRASGQMFEK